MIIWCTSSAVPRTFIHPLMGSNRLTHPFQRLSEVGRIGYIVNHRSIFHARSIILTWGLVAQISASDGFPRICFYTFQMVDISLSLCIEAPFPGRYRWGPSMCPTLQGGLPKLLSLFITGLAMNMVHGKYIKLSSFKRKLSFLVGHHIVSYCIYAWICINFRKSPNMGNSN